MVNEESDTRIRVAVSVMQHRGPIALPPVLGVGFVQGSLAANTALSLPTTVTIHSLPVDAPSSNSNFYLLLTSCH